MATRRAPGPASRGGAAPGQGWLATATALLLVLVQLSEAGLCPARCRCDDEALRSSCAYGSLDTVPIQLNPNIKHLDLSGNRISGFHMAFDFYSHLESLDLSSNVIHTVGGNNFRLQQQLGSLNLSANSLRNVSKSAFHGLASLRVLDLSNNNISDVDEQALRYTSELEFLDLSGNSIVSLPSGLLRNLHRIRSLVFARNSLLEVPASNLALTPSLERLDLSDNLIQELDKDSLPSLPTLSFLTLANNVLRSISEDAFDRTPGLKSLDLSGNNLTLVPSPALSKLKVLNNLLLNRNPLGELKNLAFRNLFELRNLEMDDCSIYWVEAKAFADNVNLERISMDGNRELTELPARVLHAAGNLRWVSLRRCSLGSLQPTQFPVDGLALLRVGGNPLICNCSVHWLWNVLRAEERRGNLSGVARLEVDTQEIICADEEFAGKPLVSLPEGALKCRLSPLWLALSVVACLLATGAVLALLAHVTRAKKRKRVPAYAAPTRPELLVYVGRANDALADKHQESYSRRLIARTEELVYEAANQDYQRRKSGSESSESRETNVYETPRYSRPGNGVQSFNAFFQEQAQQQQQQQQQQQSQQPQTTPPLPPVSHLYSTTCDMLMSSQSSLQHPAEENLYAVADVTSLREEPTAPPPPPPSTASLYRQRTAERSRSRHHGHHGHGHGHHPGSHHRQQPQHQPPAHQAQLQAEYPGYEYEYDYEPPLPPQKPHVVFV